MSEQPKTAFITGGASGIGRALSEHLVQKGYHIFIADRDLSGALALAATHNTALEQKVHYAETDVSSWPSQHAAFTQALTLFPRLSLIAPIAGIGERKWIPSKSEDDGTTFQKPDLSVVDVDLTGLLYTVALALQHFRRQEKDGFGWRGKIACVASVCGFYAVPTLPVYTAAKHGVVGLVRSLGKLVLEEGVTLNAVCPNVVRTGISTSEYYDKVDREGLLVPMEGLMEAFEEIRTGGGSGEVLECGPKGGFVRREGAEYLDEESRRSCDLVAERGRKLLE